MTPYNRNHGRLSDLIVWGALIAPSIVLNKDGSLQTTFRFRGPDLDSSTATELAATMARINNALRRLGSGWSLHVEARRRVSNDYPDVIQEPPAAWLIDEERWQLFAESGTKLVSEYFITLSYLIPEDRSAKASGWLFENKPANPSRRIGEQIATYRETVRQISDLLGTVLPSIEPLDDGETLVLALSFILIALQVFMLLIEFKLVTLGGFILLPFALLDRTTSLAQGALGYVIAASLKVFVIAVVVSFAIAFVSTLTLSEEITSTEGFAAIGVSLTFLLLAIRAPGLAASMISGGPSLGVGAIAQTVVTAAGAGAAAAYAGVAAARTGRAAGRIGIAGASGIARAGQAKGELQVQASNARLSPNTNATAGRSSTTAPTASPTAGASPSESTASKVRSDAAGAGRSLGRAGLAAGVAIPRSDDGGGSVKVDLSDRK